LENFEDSEPPPAPDDDDAADEDGLALDAAVDAADSESDVVKHRWETQRVLNRMNVCLLFKPAATDELLAAAEGAAVDAPAPFLPKKLAAAGLTLGAEAAELDDAADALAALLLSPLVDGPLAEPATPSIEMLYKEYVYEQDRQIKGTVPIPVRCGAAPADAVRVGAGA
jgi:hypothetical protein